MESILISGHTHPGLRRSANQDTCIMQHLRAGDKALAVVIDGVGGYAGGERAAAIAKDCIEQYMQTPSGDTLTMLREAVIFANNQIAAERKKDQRYGEMCCVLTAMVADALAQRIYFVHIGDTRLYRYRDGTLQKLTRDHSFVGIREDAGEMSEAEAMAHPHRNQILREVGSAQHRLDDTDFMDYESDALLPGDLLLICSDGLTDMITAQQLTGVVAAKQSPENKTARLIELANAAGGHDNITVVLLEYPATTAATKETTAPPAEKTSLPQQATIPAKKQWRKPILISILVLLLGFAGAGWYLATPQKTAPVPAGQLAVQAVIYSMTADSLQLPGTGRASHAAVQGPPAPAAADTLRISVTQNFADLKKRIDSSGKILVLIPSKPQRNHFSAITITGSSAQPGDTLTVGKLRLAGFDTGIEIQVPLVLKADNLVFENIPHPFRYRLKTGEKQAAILFINTVKQ